MPLSRNLRETLESLGTSRLMTSVPLLRQLRPIYMESIETSAKVSTTVLYVLVSIRLSTLRFYYCLASLLANAIHFKLQKPTFAFTLISYQLSMIASFNRSLVCQ